MSPKRKTALALLVLALFIGGCSGGGSTSSDTTAAEEAPHPVHIRRPNSAEVLFLLAMDNMKHEEEVNVLVTATYWRRRPTSEPRLHVVVNTVGAFGGFGTQLNGGFTFSPRRSVLEYEGQSYQVDPAALADESAGASACGRALEGVDLYPLTQSSTEKVALAGSGQERVRTAKGELNVSFGTEELTQLIGATACGKQLRAIPLVHRVLDAATGAIDKHELLTEAETWIGIRSGYRGFFTRLYLLPPGVGSDKNKGLYKGLFEVVVNNVNGVEEIPVPPRGKPLKALIKKLGREEVQALQDGAAGIAGLLRAAADGDSGVPIGG